MISRGLPIHFPPRREIMAIGSYRQFRSSIGSLLRKVRVPPRRAEEKPFSSGPLPSFVGTLLAAKLAKTTDYHYFPPSAGNTFSSRMGGTVVADVRVISIKRARPRSGSENPPFIVAYAVLCFHGPGE
jgi:hypothetical protein